MTRISTKRGDEGETDLFFGGRVSKNDPRCHAVGAVDEAVSALGLARALSRDARVKGLVKQVQRELFTVGAELATAPEQYEAMKARYGAVTPAMVERLERIMEELGKDVRLAQGFILPGTSGASAALDVARGVVRRVERHVVALKDAGLLANAEILRYLNRLADLLFVLARYQDRDLPQELLKEGDG